MAVYSVNQARHLYVANKKAADVKSITEASELATIAVGNNEDKTHMYFTYKGAGGVTRSDLINVDNIIRIKGVSASEMVTTLKKAVVTLDENVSDAPIGGQDYILKISLRQAYGMSDDSVYTKYGLVHTYNGMSASDFYKTLAISLAKNFSREITPMFKFSVDDTEVTPTTTMESLKSITATNVTIEELEQPWTLGLGEFKALNFSIYTDSILLNGDERIWGKVEMQEGTEINNGKKIADMEYFYMGERGDVYRNIGWPNVVPTTYLADSTKAYHCLEIHYAYVGSNEDCQKSEKDITIVSTDASVINDLISEIKTITGLTIEDVA